MSEILKVGVFQFNIVWEDVIANRKKVEDLLRKLKQSPDLIILPEMYSSGFTMNPSSISLKLLNDQINWQKDLSAQYKVALMGSVIIPENSTFRNRLLFTKPDNKFDYYDKRHLFFSERKSNLYSAGNERKIIKYRNSSIMPQICYDLRFPVWSRNNLNYQLLVYVSNWPSVRHKAWETLLPARAIENQCYVIGVNRVGVDGNNISYSGGSSAYNPKGECLTQLGNKEEYDEVDLSISELNNFRKKFPFYRDADNFTID